MEAHPLTAFASLSVASRACTACARYAMGSAAMRALAFLSLLGALGCGGAATHTGTGSESSGTLAQDPPPPFTLAFGSCNSLERVQVLWVQLLAQDPDVFVWLGDIIYADTQDMSRMRALYDELRAYVPYATLRSQTRILGTWDDHDYGENNAGNEYPMRAHSQRELLDFLDEPKHSARRTQEGVYAAYDFGQDPYRVRVILLDLRYHREPPGPTSDMLGKAQWEWLERQLTDSTAAVHLIGSSVQFLADEHPHEGWARFPASRARLVALLDVARPRSVLFLSGDRHMAELSVQPRTIGPDIVELTSSGMSRHWKEHDEPNRYRVGEIVGDVNFGLVRVDWQAREIRLQVKDAVGADRIDYALPLR